MTPNGLLLLWQLESAGSCTRSFSLQNAELHDLKVRRKRHKASSNDEAFFLDGHPTADTPRHETRPSDRIEQDRNVDVSGITLAERGACAVPHGAQYPCASFLLLDP